MNSLTKLWVTLSTFLVPPAKKSDRGASMLEYAAVVLLVAGIAFAVYQLSLGDSIRGAIDRAVSRILEGPTSSGPTVPQPIPNPPSEN